MSKGVSLKNIASLIKDGAHEEALELVKAGLKADPSNYNLLVYGGAALTQTAMVNYSRPLMVSLCTAITLLSTTSAIPLIQLMTNILNLVKLHKLSRNIHPLTLYDPHYCIWLSIY